VDTKLLGNNARCQVDELVEKGGSGTQTFVEVGGSPVVLSVSEDKMNREGLGKTLPRLWHIELLPTPFDSTLKLRERTCC
jgi:hypothetical protein